MLVTFFWATEISDNILALGCRIKIPVRSATWPNLLFTYGSSEAILHANEKPISECQAFLAWLMPSWDMHNMTPKLNTNYVNIIGWITYIVT